jgi:hypothetical protein
MLKLGIPVCGRFIDHMKAQHGTAFGLDFVIVVIGVFVGIQLGNWNETRVETVRRAGVIAGIPGPVRID